METSLLLINFQIALDLSWSKDCIISEISRATGPATSTITVTFLYKLYFPVVTLSISCNIKFLENMKQGFKRTVSWNKYRSEITTQLKSNNLDYMIDPAFKNIDRLFVLSFKNDSNNPMRDSFDKYYML